jgi:hypothetical protein
LSAEELVRSALRTHLLSGTGARRALDELWVPRSNERADLAVLGRTMDGFEIKTERDTLLRLPRQVAAYGRLFDRCTVVVADRHCEKVDAIVPDWWGITSVYVNGCVTFKTIRKPKTNNALDPETLVRLLWRDEAMTALVSLGVVADPEAHRASLWRELIHTASLTQLRRVVRAALATRDPSKARIPTRQSRGQALAAAAAQ